MNANELADELLAVVNVSSHVKMCASDMLRRQQAEIEELKAHPVKELTDAEIQQISHRYHYTYNPDYIGFARAILRKAQEKWTLDPMSKA